MERHEARIGRGIETRPLGAASAPGFASSSILVVADVFHLQLVLRHERDGWCHPWPLDPLSADKASLGEVAHKSRSVSEDGGAGT